MTIPPLSAGLPAATAAAARGLQMAGARFADSATRIALAGAVPAAAPPEAAARAAIEAPDLGRAMVDMIQARQAYAANAVVLRTADEAMDELVRRTA